MDLPSKKQVAISLAALIFAASVFFVLWIGSQLENPPRKVITIVAVSEAVIYFALTKESNSPAEVSNFFSENCGFELSKMARDPITGESLSQDPDVLSADVFLAKNCAKALSGKLFSGEKLAEFEATCLSKFDGLAEKSERIRETNVFLVGLEYSPQIMGQLLFGQTNYEQGILNNCLNQLGQIRIPS